MKEKFIYRRTHFNDKDIGLIKMQCPDNEIHIWYISVEEFIKKNNLLSAMEVLSKEEKLRYHRFRFDKDKKEFLATRFLVRTVLSKYITRLLPEEFEFCSNAYGKPDLIESQKEAGINFNISHSEGFVMLAVSKCVHLGVDVEYIEKKLDYISFAEHVFSKAEWESLRGLPKDECKRRFFTIWTLKESLIKAKGMGLSLPLDQFSFELNESEIKIDFSEDLCEQAKNWRFKLLKPDEHHQAAISVKSEKEITIVEINK